MLIINIKRSLLSPAHASLSLLGMVFLTCKITQKLTHMKNLHFPNHFLAVLVLVFSLSTNLFSQQRPIDSSQRTTTWKGGAPGMENDWNCPKNWSNYRVPDKFDNVIIPDVSTTTLAPPVIKNGRVEVNSLYLDTNANLIVHESAQLVVFQREASFIPLNFRPAGRIFLLDETSEDPAAASAALK